VFWPILVLVVAVGYEAFQVFDWLAVLATNESYQLEN
jgi:hypothetical protein